MNLSPLWCETLAVDGHDAVHWRDIGRQNASDDDILAWAGLHRRAVMTGDLGFGAAIVRRGLSEPAVIQFRCSNTDPVAIGGYVRDILRSLLSDIRDGAIVTIDDDRVRLRPPSIEPEFTEE